MLFAILLPPTGVLFEVGLAGHLWLKLLLTPARLYSGYGACTLIGEEEATRCKCWNPNMIVMLTLAIVIVIAPLAGAFSGMGESFSGSGDLGTARQAHPPNGEKR